MSASTLALESPRGKPAWLRDQNWDLLWISLSVVLVAAPYLSYIGLLKLTPLLQPVANFFGASVDSLVRNLLNALIAFLVGGPHMYATWTRTYLDRGFTRQRTRFAWSSLLVPVVVVTLALLNLPLLLTVFFFWASIHVLHQVIYIVDLYSHRQKNLSKASRLADYGVVLTALYPLAAWKIANGTFFIGPNDLGAVVGKFVPRGPWMVWLAGGAFGLALAFWISSCIRDYLHGSLNTPKTLFIALTVTASFFIPALGNLDTAFQGMNVWHSLQYLALTWMLNNLRQSRGELDSSPFVKKMSTDGSARRYYSFNFMLTLGDVGVAAILFLILRYALGLPFDAAFDRSYYIAVLAFLWIHYYFDHYLFTQAKVIG